MTVWEALLKITMRKGNSWGAALVGSINVFLYAVQFGIFAYAIAWGARLGWGS